MKTLLKIVGGLIATVLVLLIGLVLFVLATLKADLPESQFTLRAPDTLGQYNVLVFGATGKLGNEIVQDLVLQGDKVTAFVRPSSDRTLLEALNVDFAVGDVFNAESIAAAFANDDFDAVIVTIAAMGVPDLDRVGNINVADAAEAAGVKRLIMVSTIGAGDSQAAAPLLSRLALANILPQKTAAEDHIRTGALDYTIVRPGGLPPGIIPTGEGLLSEDPTTMGFIKRPDLARLIIGMLYDDNTIGKTLTAVDPTLNRPWDGGDGD